MRTRVCAYLVFAVPINVLEILESLDCVNVFSTLLGYAFRARLNQIFHKSHGLIEKKNKSNQRNSIRVNDFDENILNCNICSHPSHADRINCQTVLGVSESVI